MVDTARSTLYVDGDPRKASVNWTSDRAAVLLEFALIIPLVLMITIGGVNLGLATIEKTELVNTLHAAASLPFEDDVAGALGAVGARLDCYVVLPGGDECYPDGYPTGAARRQVLAVKVHHVECVLFSFDVDLTATDTRPQEG